jgi:hypothetical protein
MAGQLCSFFARPFLMQFNDTTVCKLAAFERKNAFGKQKQFGRLKLALWNIISHTTIYHSKKTRFTQWQFKCFYCGLPPLNWPFKDDKTLFWLESAGLAHKFCLTEFCALT